MTTLRRSPFSPLGAFAILAFSWALALGQTPAPTPMPSPTPAPTQGTGKTVLDVINSDAADQAAIGSAQQVVAASQQAVVDAQAKLAKDQASLTQAQSAAVAGRTQLESTLAAFPGVSFVVSSKVYSLGPDGKLILTTVGDPSAFLVPAPPAPPPTPDPTPTPNPATAPATGSPRGL